MLRLRSRSSASRRVPLLALLAATVATGCGGDADAPPSALLITIDTLRADAVGAYGGRAGLTPHLDRLADEGILFEQAYATVPLTLPSHASMLTGLTPPRHGVHDNGYEVLPRAADTVAERALAAGARTAAFLSASVLHADFGLAQGFETYDCPDDSEQRATSDYPSRRASEAVDAAIRWLDQRDRDEPYFLWVHLWDVHKPWEPGPEFRSRAPGNPYLQEVASADAALGRLIEHLRDEGTLDATTVVVVSDHGEALGEHGESEHGVFCYDATMRVPLIVRPAAADADERRGTRVETLASVVDVAPTLLHGLGADPLDEVDGFDLHGALPEGRGVYLESYYAYRAYGWSPIAGWVGDEGKFLHSSEPEFYDLRDDPGEQDDLYASSGQIVRGYRDEIGRLVSRPSLPPEEADISEERQAELRALGYAAVGTTSVELPHPLARSDRPSPRAQVELLPKMERAYSLLSTGQYAAAERAYAEILAQDRQNLWCSELYATSLLAQGRAAAAIPPLEAVINGVPRQRDQLGQPRPRPGRRGTPGRGDHRLQGGPRAQPRAHRRRAHARAADRPGRDARDRTALRRALRGTYGPRGSALRLRRRAGSRRRRAAGRSCRYARGTGARAA